MRGGRLVGTVIAIAVAVSSLGLLVGSSPAVAAPIELVERRTAYSKTFQNDDGTETLELSGRPLHYQNDAGHWVDVDVRLEAELGPDYSYSAKKNRPKVWLPRKASQAARFEVGQHYLRFQPVGAADADVIRRDETTVAFSGVWQNTDLSYQVIPEGLKENIVIQSRPSPTTFPFELDYPGVSPQLESDGSIAFLSAETGEELWRFPRPYAVEMHEGASPSYEAVHYQLQQRGTAATVSLVVDPQWLDNPARQFPVLIDPTTVSLGSGSDSRSITTYASQTVTYWWRLEAPACMGTDRYGKVKIGTWSGGG
ncbi:MAG: hypothetical protein ACM3UP_00255, partial [Methanocella sp.]